MTTTATAMLIPQLAAWYGTYETAKWGISATLPRYESTTHGQIVSTASAGAIAGSLMGTFTLLADAGSGANRLVLDNYAAKGAVARAPTSAPAPAVLPMFFRPPLHCFPDYAEEYSRHGAARSSLSLPMQRLLYVGKAAIAHAALFTVYEGLLVQGGGGRLPSTDGETSTAVATGSASDALQSAFSRFLAGGVASLGFRAAWSGFVASGDRRIMTPAENARFMGRSFVMVGCVTALGGIIRDAILAG